MGLLTFAGVLAVGGFGYLVYKKGWDAAVAAVAAAAAAVMLYATDAYNTVVNMF